MGIINSEGKEWRLEKKVNLQDFGPWVQSRTSQDNEHIVDRNKLKRSSLRLSFDEA